jgi:hypothetical protein
VISYEFPLNERIRTLLRLEDLFTRFAYFVAKTDAHDHHAALLVLFEIVDVASRADLKSDLIQELERQKQLLEALRNNPQIAEDALESVLQEIEQTSAKLLEMVGRFGQYLRENDWYLPTNTRSTFVSCTRLLAATSRANTIRMSNSTWLTATSKEISAGCARAQQAKHLIDCKSSCYINRHHATSSCLTRIQSDRVARRAASHYLIAVRRRLRQKTKRAHLAMRPSCTTQAGKQDQNA